MQTASMGPVPAALHCSWVSSLEVYPHWVNTSYEGYLDRIPLERMISIANELDALRWDILGGSTTTQQAGCTYKGPNASWLEDLIALFNSRWFYGHSLKKEMMIKKAEYNCKAVWLQEGVRNRMMMKYGLLFSPYFLSSSCLNILIIQTETIFIKFA